MGVLCNTRVCVVKYVGVCRVIQKGALFYVSLHPPPSTLASLQRSPHQSLPPPPPTHLHQYTQDAIDSSIQQAKGTPPLQTVLGGTFAQQIIARGVPFASEREEEFCGISVDVRGKRGLIESLESYVQGELMEGDNQYYCEQFNTKVCREGGGWLWVLVGDDGLLGKGV